MKYCFFSDITMICKYHSSDKVANDGKSEGKRQYICRSCGARGIFCVPKRFQAMRARKAFYPANRGPPVDLIMSHDSRWMRNTAKEQRKSILENQLLITENLAKACSYMSCLDASNASCTLLLVVDALNGLWSFIDSFQTVVMKRLVDRYGLCSHEGELETCTQKIFSVIEKMKGAVNQWQTELRKSPPNLKETAYYDIIDSSRIDLFNTLSEYHFRTLTALAEVVVSYKE